MYERLSLLLGRAYALELGDLEREEGQTTVEYAAIVALVVVMAIAVFATLSTAVGGFFTSIATKLGTIIS